MVFQLGKKYSFLNNLTGEIGNKSNVIIRKKDNKLSFEFEIFDKNIFSPYKNDNDELYNHDVVEVFISFNNRNDEYFEYELSPFNKRFFGYIKNKTLISPSLTLIEPTFYSEISLFDGGYKAKIVLDNVSDINNILLNCFYVDSDGENLIFYSINPTKNKSFHLSSYLSKLID